MSKEGSKNFFSKIMTGCTKGYGEKMPQQPNKKELEKKSPTNIPYERFKNVSEDWNKNMYKK